jgi:hypothetical protein
MRIIYLFLVLFVVGCSSDTNEIEKLTLLLELKEKESELKEKESELKEKEIAMMEKEITMREKEVAFQEKEKEYKENREKSVSKSKSSKTFILGNLEVMRKDLGIMSWYDANKACADLGDGWRLPTQTELKLLFKNRKKIGGFEYGGYYSSDYKMGDPIFGDGYNGYRDLVGSEKWPYFLDFKTNKVFYTESPKDRHYVRAVQFF